MAELRWCHASNKNQVDQSDAVVHSLRSFRGSRVVMVATDSQSTSASEADQDSYRNCKLQYELVPA
jgi:hypothetical protein